MSYNENISSNQPTPEITLENYEMYFLMYVDNELNDSEMAAVDAFLLVHPNLQLEMDQLQSTILQLPNIDSIVLPNKLNLYKSENDTIDSSLEEKILLSIDKELSEKDERSLQNELTQHLIAQSLYKNYQSTVLPIENIEFPNKEILYKSTGKSISIFRTRWVELSIAAAVALFVVVNVFNPKKPNEIITEAIETPSVQISEPKNVEPIVDTKTSAISVEQPNNVVEKPIQTSNFNHSNLPVNNKIIEVDAPISTVENNIEKNISNESNISIVPNVEHTNTSTEKVQPAVTEEDFIASFEMKNDSEALLADKQLEDLKSLMATNELQEIDDHSFDPIPLRGLFKKVKNEVFKHNRNSKNSYSIHFR